MNTDIVNRPSGTTQHKMLPSLEVYKVHHTENSSGLWGISLHLWQHFMKSGREPRELLGEISGKNRCALSFTTHMHMRTHIHTQKGGHLCVAYHLRLFDSWCALICAVLLSAFEVKISATFASRSPSFSLSPYTSKQTNHKWPPPVIFVTANANSKLIQPTLILTE